MAKKYFEHDEIIERFKACESFWSPEYKRSRDDTSFALGLNQWPDNIKKDREDEGRPCLTENRMLVFTNQVINSMRQARPSIIPKPVDSAADVEVAEIMRGVIRNIETSSDASSVYDTASRNSVMGGIGWIRIATDYASKDSFDQEAIIERIQNPESVYLDPNHQRQDGSDANFGFVFTDMDEEEFERQYPKAAKSSIENSGWSTEETVRIAEYFERCYEDKVLVEYEYLTIAGYIRGTAFEDKVPAGANIIRKRNTQVCKIKYCKLNGAEILEEGEFAGEYIPLVPVYGFEAFVDGKRSFYSLIHQGRDPQMMLNFWKSASTEIMALQPKAPWVGYAGQFATYEDEWKNANRINYPFLEADLINDANGNPLPLPQRQPPPQGSPAMLQEASMAADAIKATIGMYDASLGAQSADISGKAIISRQMQGDNATFHFVDNLSVAIRHVGRILIGLIPIIYTGQRIVRIMGEDGTNSLVPLNRPVKQVGKEYQVADDGVGKIISFDAGKYDVVVEVGASYATKRQELSNAIIEISRVNPEIMNVAGDLFMKSLDVPYAEEIAKRIRATMPPSLLGEDVEAQRLQELTNAMNQMQEKLTLTEQALLAKETNQEFKNKLEAAKVENDTIKLKIDAALAEAEIAKKEAETRGLVMQDVNDIAAVIADLRAQQVDIAGAVHELISAKEEEATGAPEAPVIEGINYVGQPDIGSSA